MQLQSFKEKNMHSIDLSRECSHFRNILSKKIPVFPHNIFLDRKTFFPLSESIIPNNLRSFLENRIGKRNFHQRLLCKDCISDRTSFRTWSLLIFPVVVSGKGFLHSMNIFGILNLKEEKKCNICNLF